MDKLFMINLCIFTFALMSFFMVIFDWAKKIISDPGAFDILRDHPSKLQGNKGYIAVFIICMCPILNIFIFLISFYLLTNEETSNEYLTKFLNEVAEEDKE